MNILALDTCFDACSAAAGRGLRSLTPSIAFASEPMSVGHAERLLPMIEMVMSEAGMSIAELDRIAVASGPGTFTGSRIAVSAARALALASGAAIVAVTSLELMAMSHSLVTRRVQSLAIATDARRGEVYIQHFEAGSLKTSGPPQLLSIREAAAMLGAGPVLIGGSGAAVVAGQAQAMGHDAVAVLPGLHPEAIDMLFTAMSLPTTPLVSPLYLRPPDAKPPAACNITGMIA